MKKITARQANSGQYPKSLQMLVDDAYICTGSLPALVFYVINKKQSGFHKIMYDREQMFESYDEAEKYRLSLQPKVLRDGSEVRCGLFVEGPAVKP